MQTRSVSPGLRDAPRMLVAPGDVFRRIGESGRYGWALGAVVLISTLVGWTTVQTGLIDREVDRRTRQALADLEREQTDLLKRTELSERMEGIRKSAEFTKLIARGSAILVAPAALAASLMILAALLFAMVALTGQKPEYAVLIAVCVYSAVVDVLAEVVRLAMRLSYRTLDVDTSLSVLVPYSEGTRTLKLILSGIDPFRVWFWVLVALGLIVTGQLSRRAAMVTCTVFGLIAAGVRIIPTPVHWPSG